MYCRVIVDVNIDEAGSAPNEVDSHSALEANTAKLNIYAIFKSVHEVEPRM